MTYTVESKRLEVTLRDNLNGLLATSYTTEELLETFTKRMQRNDYTVVAVKKLYECEICH